MSRGSTTIVLLSLSLVFLFVLIIGGGALAWFMLRKTVEQKPIPIIETATAASAAPKPPGTWIAMKKATSVPLASVWGFGSAAYATGDAGTVIFIPRPDDDWTTMDAASAAGSHGLYGIGGDLGTEIAVGAGGTIVRLGDPERGWSADKSNTTADLSAVFVRGTNAWAVGKGGAIVKLDDTGAWQKDASGAFVDLTAIAGDASRVIAVGRAGTIVALQDPKKGWKPVKHPGFDDLYGVAVGKSGAWAVGARGALLAEKDGTWSVSTSGVKTDLRAVWATAGHVFAVGAGGVILHARDDGAWAKEDAPAKVDLRGVAGAGGVVYAVGNDGTVLQRTSLE